MLNVIMYNTLYRPATRILSAKFDRARGVKLNFEFVSSTRVKFGSGRLRSICDDIIGLGHHALVVHGRDASRARHLLEKLDGGGVKTSVFSVAGEPTISIIRDALNRVRSDQIDLIIGIGGGSVLDTGKAIAALATNSGDPTDYLEVIGAGKPLIHTPLSYVAVPTSAGSGAEVTHNAVLKSTKHAVKVSLRSPLMAPILALIDPELTLSLPPPITATTGLDAMVQLIEPFVSIFANPMTDALCRDGLRRVGRSLRRAYDAGDDLAAREDMALASLYGGLALSNAKLGAVHGFAGPIGGMYQAAHGAICAALIPHVTAINIRELKRSNSSHKTLTKYDEVGALLTGRPDATSHDMMEWIENTVAGFRIPGLSEYGLKINDFQSVIDKARLSSSMKGNPIILEGTALTEILTLSF